MPIVVLKIFIAETMTMEKEMRKIDMGRMYQDKIYAATKNETD